MLRLLPLIASAAASLLPRSNSEARSAHGYPPDLEITSGPVLTSKWFEGSNYEQVVEMIVTNNSPRNSLTLADTLNITAQSADLYMTRSATITRLHPGQSAVVQVGVKPNNGFTQGSTCSVDVTLTYGEAYGNPITSSASSSGICGVQYNYTNTEASVNNHWNPDWFNDVKFGIFIHWGLYSAPAYGSVSPNEDYAEWYWHRMVDGPDFRTHTYQYHEETYGQEFNYDQFINNFTASQWNPKAWMDLVNTAGAQYIVPVTKHHDGFALFNFSTAISKRSSVHYGPKRDFIGELFAAAKEYYPNIKRGTYFSLPEWYNPDYAKYAYGGGGGFPGGPPKNPYTGAEVPYTGHVNVSDFIADVQMPQMYTLAYNYDSDIMWCDIEGSANDAGTFAANFINNGMLQNRQVTFNSRCGGGSGYPGDFDTPEYTTNSGSVARKWESNRGMDPFSFGYNYQTPDSAYLTGNDVVQSLVDIVSKNGNFLLDIGPTNEGVIPAIMVQGLTDAGSWIHAHSESIFSTKYWQTTPGLDPYRYTTTDSAFYIHVISQPGTIITPPDQIPFLPGDTVTVLGGSMNGTVVPTTWNSNGTITMEITDDIINADKYVWTFKLSYTSTW